MVKVIKSASISGIVKVGVKSNVNSDLNISAPDTILDIDTSNIHIENRRFRDLIDQLERDNEILRSRIKDIESQLNVQIKQDESAGYITGFKSGQDAAQKEAEERLNILFDAINSFSCDNQLILGELQEASRKIAISIVTQLIGRDFFEEKFYDRLISKSVKSIVDDYRFELIVSPSVFLFLRNNSDIFSGIAEFISEDLSLSGSDSYIAVDGKFWDISLKNHFKNMLNLMEKSINGDN